MNSYEMNEKSIAVYKVASQALLKKGIGENRKNLFARNQIDLGKIVDKARNPIYENPKIDLGAISAPVQWGRECFSSENILLSINPVFKHGLLKFGDKLISWDVISLEKNVLSVKLQGYALIKNELIIGIGAVFHFSGLDKSIGIDYDDGYMNWSELYSLIAVKNRIPSYLKNEYSAALDKHRMRVIRIERNGFHVMDELSNLFVVGMMTANYLFEQKKKRIVSSSTVISVIDESKKIHQSIQTIGKMKVIELEEKKLIEKKSSTKTIHYSTPTWTARGGIRRLKSGKLVPFKACVKHRKKVGDECKILPTIIKAK